MNYLLLVHKTNPQYRLIAPAKGENLREYLKFWYALDLDDFDIRGYPD